MVPSCALHYHTVAACIPYDKCIGPKLPYGSYVKYHMVANNYHMVTVLAVVSYLMAVVHHYMMVPKRGIQYTPHAFGNPLASIGKTTSNFVMTDSYINYFSYACFARCDFHAVSKM